MFLRYDAVTGLAGNAYDIPVPTPFIEITTEQHEQMIASEDLYFVNNGELTTEPTPEYIEYLKQKERERLDMLCLTRADVERAIYQVKGLDFTDILNMVKDNPKVDAKALGIEFNANHFYRGNPYVNQIGLILGFTSEKLDKFFETNNPEDLK